jgi:hypothetical protein
LTRTVTPTESVNGTALPDKARSDTSALRTESTEPTMADDPSKTPDGDQPKSLSEEDVGRIVNAAVTSQLKRMVPSAISDAVKGLDLDSKFEALAAKLAPAQPEKPQGEGSASALPAEVQAQLKKMADELESEKAARVAAEQQRAEIENARRFDSGLSAFRGAVAQKVRPDLLDVFVRDIAHGQKRLTVGEDGTAKLTVRRVPYKGAPEETVDLPLEEAIPLLLSQKDVAPFLPAPGGQQGGNGQQPAIKGLPLGIPVSTGGDSDKLAASLAAFEKLGIDPKVLGG